MKRAAQLAITFILFLVPGKSSAQDVQVNRSNRTIAVTASERVSADAEVAEIRFGYRNTGTAKEAVYDENVRIANKVVAALLAAGIQKEQIETSSMGLERVGDQPYESEKRKEKEFMAHQTWVLRVPASEAQKAVDLAVSAGANQIEEVNWTVKDPEALETQAGTRALAKAKEIAARLAKEFGGKVGELLFIGNESQMEDQIALFATARNKAFAYKMVTVQASKLQLFPEKVTREATVHAVFALD